MSKAQMLVATAVPGVQVPDGYVLVSVNNTPGVASNSKSKPTYGKNWNRNQRKRERLAQEPARNPSAAPPPAPAGIVSTPAAMQAGSPARVEAGPSPCSRPAVEKDDVVVEPEPTAEHPGYYTVSYAQHRADKLAIRNENNLSAEVMLSHVQKLLNSFARVLASPDPGAEFEVVRTWKYCSNGATVITGGNVISVACEILFFYKLYGNPCEGDTFLTPALDCINVHASMIKGSFLKDWTEEKVLQLNPDQILAKLDSVTKTETFAILKKFLNVLDGCSQLAARLPQSIYVPCYKFVGRSDEPRWVNDAYAMGSSTRYNQALNSLVKHVQNDHVQLLGVNQINLLLKGTGISLNRFTGFAQAESRLANAKNRDINYPTQLDLLNLCGLPLPAQYQSEEIQKLKHQLELQAEENQKVKDKIDHLINIQIQNSNQINELKGLILQASGASQTGTVTIPEPSIDDKQSIDHLLADEDGHDMEQEESKIQHVEQNVDQESNVDGVPQPPDDELSAAVDSLMVDLQNQE